MPPRRRTPANRQTIDLTLPSPPLPHPTTSRAHPRTRSQTAASHSVRSLSRPLTEAADPIREESDVEMVDEEVEGVRRRRVRPGTRAETSRRRQQPEVLELRESSSEYERLEQAIRTVSRRGREVHGLHLPPGGRRGGLPYSRHINQSLPRSRHVNETEEQRLRRTAGHAASLPPVAGPSQKRKRDGNKESPSSSSPELFSDDDASIPLNSPTPPIKGLEEPLHLLTAYTCPICFSPPVNATVTPCGHLMCGGCLYASARANMERAANAHGGFGAVRDVQPACPVCRATLGLSGTQFTKNAAVGLVAEEVVEVS